MSSEQIHIPSTGNTALNTSSLSSQSSSLPLWDRLTTWASENKTIVYTVAGVAVVVTGAGLIYYRSDSRTGTRGTAAEAEADAKKRASKKERRKAKQDKEKGQAQPDTNAGPEQGEQQG